MSIVTNIYVIANNTLERATRSKLPVIINFFSRILGMNSKDIEFKKNALIYKGVRDDSHPIHYSQCSDLLCLTYLLGVKELTYRDIFLCENGWISVSCSMCTKSLFGAIKFHDEDDNFINDLLPKFVSDKIIPNLASIRQACHGNMLLEHHCKLLIKRLDNL